VLLRSGHEVLTVNPSEFRPTLQALSTKGYLLSFSKSFPTIIETDTPGDQLRHASHSHTITAVTCMLHNTIVASGDVESNVHVWEYHSNLLLSRIKCSLRGGPIRLTFSENERLLGGLFLDKNYYYLALFDIHQGLEVSVVSLGQSPVRSIMFKKKLEIVSIGEEHLFLWKYTHGNLVGDAVPFYQFSRDLYSQAMNKLDMVIGTGSGKIQVLREQLHSDKILDPQGNSRIISLAVSNL
jgi:WD40 repeat protein